MRSMVIIVAATLLIGAGCSASRQESVSTERADHKNIAYVIEGESVRLINGAASSDAIPGSATATITRYFGNEARADFDGDGSEDVAFLITRDGGGSGTFYYIVVALGNGDGYRGTNAAFLGDRIHPQTTEFRDGRIIVNFAERKTDPSAPSMGVSRYFNVSDGILVEVTR